jgi:sulfate/thiosulfate transport system substrate-binding protein
MTALHPETDMIAKTARWSAAFTSVVALIVPPLLQGCAGRGGQGPVRVILGAYTAPRELYNKALIPAFQKLWKDKTGQTVDFLESYQGSGTQSRAIVGGFEADVVALSLAGDVDRIVDAGLITHDWKTEPNNGIVSTSIVVIAVRRGNPLGIRDWADLTVPGLNVLTPDPKTSGGAQWNINAVYGAALRGFTDVQGNDPAAAKEFLKRVLSNVSIMDRGARESITTFEKGVGDAAITYENEVLVGRQAGQTYDYVIPRSTILIETPVAVVDANLDKHGVREVASEFVRFLWSKEAQRACARYGFRPVDDEVAREFAERYPPVQDAWTIAFLGGWKGVAVEMYGSDGVYTRTIENLHGSK